MSSFVIDASVTLAVIFEDENSPYADAVVELLRRDQAATSSVWPLEIANAILNAVRRGRVSEVDVPVLVDAVHALKVDVVQGMATATLTQAVVSLAIEHRLSAYDASYLELALRRGVPLATNDRRLRDAAEIAGIPICSREPQGEAAIGPGCSR